MSIRYAAVLGAAALVLSQPTSADRDDVAAVLRAAAEYVAHYEQAFSTVVAEEQYVQRLRTSRSGRVVETTQLRSDVLLANAGEAGWIWFRDVFEVDGRPVRDRDQRLIELFLKPRADSHAQARTITEESARFNIGPLQRTVNVPTLALAFFRSDRQSGSTFALERLTRIDGRETAPVRFVESGDARLIATPDDAPAQGRAWIEPVSGRIVRTELEIRTSGTRTSIRVTYAPEARMPVWVPVQMREEYAVPVTQAGPTDPPRTVASTPPRFEVVQEIEARATYSRFRQFSVSTSVIQRDDR